MSFPIDPKTGRLPRPADFKAQEMTPIDDGPVVGEVLREIEGWIRFLPPTYGASVRLFAIWLPPQSLLEALWITQSRMPRGERGAFEYFCGVCHRMRRELLEKRARE